MLAEDKALEYDYVRSCGTLSTRTSSRACSRPMDSLFSQWLLLRPHEDSLEYRVETLFPKDRHDD